METQPATGATHTRVYRRGVLDAEGFPLAEVSDHLDTPDAVVWVDFCGPSKAQLHQLAGELGLHELAVEDALGPHQRPKVDYYADHLFMSCQALRVGSGQHRIESTEIDAFVGARWIVTVRKDEAFALGPVERRLDRSPELAGHGVGFLLYGLLDVVVDDYFDVVQAFEDYYDDASEGIFTGRPLDPAEQRLWFDTRRALVRFHRLVVPMREAVGSLMRRDEAAVTPELYPYFQDVYDHLLRVSEATDSLRELISTIVETNLSLQDFRQNQIVKKVSSWAAIVAIPAFLTGYFGMNVPYPGSGEPWGAVAATALIVVLSMAMYWLFKRKDWL